MKIIVELNKKKIESENQDAMFLDELVDLFTDTLIEIGATKENIADEFIRKAKELSAEKNILVF